MAPHEPGAADAIPEITGAVLRAEAAIQAANGGVLPAGVATTLRSVVADVWQQATEHERRQRNLRAELTERILRGIYARLRRHFGEE